jgi:hypothetical protein
MALSELRRRKRVIGVLHEVRRTSGHLGIVAHRRLHSVDPPVET